MRHGHLARLGAEAPRLRGAALAAVEALAALGSEWAHDLRWWDPPARRRRVLWHVVIDGGPDAVAIACLVAVESGRAAVEAVYD